ncbi:hypothetical protein V490_08587 [Pseudogymnoascus sp. VKM F-3557]|nr:hypothetical protein V490_08587 [Pseudogymnoascus sp. VKM F-3557]
MALPFFRDGFILLLFAVTIASALRITPNSPCTTVCVNGGSTADQTLAGTHEGDIVCNDADYTSKKGLQFQECLDCLQGSSFGTDADNDQMWFIYNLRYASDYCFFGINNAVTLSGPCMVDSTCNPLSKSLSAGNESTETGAIFDYCTADDSDFTQMEPICYSCMKNMDGNIYISNFLTALNAGCSQRPSQSSPIGLDGSVFSVFPVNITSTPFNPAEASAATSKGGLSTGAKAGIAVGCVLVAIIIAAAVLIYIFKCRRARNLATLNTQYDPRHGSSGITPPVEGAYSYKEEPIPAPYSNYKVEPASEDWNDQNIALHGVNRSTSPPASAYTKFSSISSGRSSLVGSPEPLTLAAAPVGMRAITPLPTQAPTPPQAPAGPPNPLRMNSVIAATQRPSVQSQPAQAPYNPRSSSSTYMHFNRPGRASSILSTSTTFSPPSATSPPSYPTTLYNHRPPIPLPTYNPRDYAPRVAPPPTQPLPQPPLQRLDKQTVPIIAMPIPAPRRDTMDMRSFIGLGISTNNTSTVPVPSSVPISAVQSDGPVPLSRNASLREIAARLLPGSGNNEGGDGAQKVVKQDRGRRRSGSRPRRGRSESRTRLRDDGMEGERRPFEFRGQDAVGKETVSPLSAAESVEQWPGKM